MSAVGPLLLIDTATTRAVIAVGEPDGAVVEARSWTAGYRHGEELLARIDALLADRGVDRRGLRGVVVGTGPGAFTGLRVGIATAKGIAHAFGIPIAGVPTGGSLIAAAALASGTPEHRLVLAQPAGPSDLVVSRADGGAAILPGGAEPALEDGETLVAVDLAGRAAEDATALGESAVAGLAAAMLARGAERIAGGGDDLARLVPEYVTLPRGVRMALPDDGVELSGGSRR